MGIRTNLCMRLPFRHRITYLVTALFTISVSTGIAAAQQSEINNSLSQIEQFVATTLGQIGVIVFLVGAALWFVSGSSANRSQWGWRALGAGPPDRPLGQLQCVRHTLQKSRTRAAPATVFLINGVSAPSRRKPPTNDLSRRSSPHKCHHSQIHVSDHWFLASSCYFSC